MIELIVIVESDADARIATHLAERVLLEKIDWLETSLLPNLFRWSGLEENSDRSYWRDAIKIINNYKRSGLHMPRFLRRKKIESPLKSDEARTMKILNLIQALQHQSNRQIKAVLFIRDLDHQPERKEGMEHARLEYIEQQPKLEIIIGVANRMREAWVLNGFIASNPDEDNILTDIKTQLNFDPCEEAHRLRERSFQEPDRIRNPKVVVEQLTRGDRDRERQCWETTPLHILRERGVYTGLTAYMDEIEQRLVPIIID
ncbi:hypothetical protein [Lyngbya sp. CCY1209]|uniref:hypothetical protein n=1 Tax=Lyngbya sp. CCY1209 TaxID=2886103 RepID=UPI002D1FD04F|nr:hypothetical protein [Lyngbya sp. CCY1209]MEB3885192.1 hypothetical protein [Lyngbya sp. CCY1209]